MAIRAAESPGKARRLAARPDARSYLSAQSWFRKNGEEPRADWHEVKLDIMRRADRAKYAQHSALGEWPVATEDATLIEDAPSEPQAGGG